MKTKSEKFVFRRIFSLLLAASLSVLLVLHGTVGVRAAYDEVDEFAWEFRCGVETNYSEYLIVTEISDMDYLLMEMFTRYPILYHYYDGCSWTVYSDRTEVTMKFKNQADDFDEICVVDSEEELFAVVGLGLAELRESVKFVTTNWFVPSDEIVNDIFQEMQYNYHLAYMGYNSWSTNYTYDDSYGIRDYEFTYIYFYELRPDTLRQWRAETEQVALELAESLFAQDMPDYMKVLRIHDWIINKTQYNIIDMDEPGNHLAYGALVKGSCVCMGYAEAANLLFQTAGVEVLYITGYGVSQEGDRESHAWNAVKLDDYWYMIDITWDDPVTDDGSELLLYDYFNVTSDQLAKNHEWDYPLYPQCLGTLYNAQTVQDLVAQDTNVYTEYSSDRLVTQEEARDHFLSILEGIPIVLPEKVITQATEPEPETQPSPAETEAAPETNPIQETQAMQETQPAIDPNPTTGPEPTIAPKPDHQEQPDDSSGGMWVWIVLAVVLVIGGGGAFLFIRKNREREAASTRYDSTYGFDNLPKRW